MGMARWEVKDWHQDTEKPITVSDDIPEEESTNMVEEPDEEKGV